MAARLGRPLAQGVLEDVQHRRRRQVADLGERTPGERDGLVGQAQRLLQRVDHLRPAGVADPPADVGTAEPVVGEEPVDVLADVAPDHDRHLGVQHDPQAGAPDVEAHHPLRVRVEPAAGAQHAGRGRLVAVLPRRDDTRGAVAEQPAGDQVRHRDVVALHGERAQLDGHEHRDLARVTREVVGQPGDPGSTRHTAEAEQRHPLHVRPQPDEGGDPRVQGRYGETRHRRRDDQVDIGRREVGGLERVLQRPGAQLDGVLDEVVVGGREAVELAVLLEGQHGVPELDPGVGVEAAQQPLVEAPALGDDTGERVGDLGLRVAVRRQRAAHCQDLHQAPPHPRDCLATQAGHQPAHQPSGDPAVAEPELDQLVEDLIVAARDPDAPVHDHRVLRQPGGDAGVLEVPAEQRTDRLPVQCAGVAPIAQRRVRRTGRPRSRWRPRSRCPRRSSG